MVVEKGTQRSSYDLYDFTRFSMIFRRTPEPTPTQGKTSMASTARQNGPAGNSAPRRDADMPKRPSLSATTTPTAPQSPLSVAQARRSPASSTSPYQQRNDQLRKLTVGRELARHVAKRLLFLGQIEIHEPSAPRHTSSRNRRRDHTGATPGRKHAPRTLRQAVRLKQEHQRPSMVIVCHQHAAARHG